MSETEQETLKSEVIDPPENQDGGGAQALNVEGGSTEIQPLDPPDGNGGGGGGKVVPVSNP